MSKEAPANWTPTPYSASNLDDMIKHRLGHVDISPLGAQNISEIHLLATLKSILERLDQIDNRAHPFRLEGPG